MGLSASTRPVVLIVEDLFLLRMDAVDMIAAAGFDVVEVGDADEAIDSWSLAATSRSCLPIHRSRPDGWAQTCPRRQGPLGRRSRFSRRRALWMSGKTICPKEDGFCRSPTTQRNSRACCAN